MRTRKKNYGNSNMIGRNVEQLRLQKNISQRNFIAKLQTAGLDINPTSYSKLEGQIRMATDKEVFIISQVLGVRVDVLFGSKSDRGEK